MIDEKIVDMYWARSESAIEETSKKYGRYFHTIAYNILRNEEDSQECVSDTYLSAWKAMPSERPRKLSAFLGRITRNLALSRYEYYSAEKRGGCQVSLALDELAECVPENGDYDPVTDRVILKDVLNRFLEELDENSRNIFVSRYFYLNSSGEIAKKYSMTENNVNVILYRVRNRLKDILKQEGIY